MVVVVVVVVVVVMATRVSFLSFSGPTEQLGASGLSTPNSSNPQPNTPTAEGLRILLNRLDDMEGRVNARFDSLDQRVSTIETTMATMATKADVERAACRYPGNP